jgi:hypothetical protein
MIKVCLKIHNCLIIRYGGSSVYCEEVGEECWTAVLVVYLAWGSCFVDRIIYSYVTGLLLRCC